MTFRTVRLETQCSDFYSSVIKTTSGIVRDSWPYHTVYLPLTSSLLDQRFSKESTLGGATIIKITEFKPLKNPFNPQSFKSLKHTMNYLTGEEERKMSNMINNGLKSM